MGTVIELLSSRGVEQREVGAHHHARAGWVQFDCPFCSPGSKHFRLGLNLSRGYFNCWACGPKKLAEAVGALLNIGRGEANHLTKGLERPRAKQEEERPVNQRLILPPGIEDTFAAVHRRYLQDRGLDPDEMVALWGMKGIGRLGGRYAWRLFLPVTLDHRTVSWTTRAVGFTEDSRYIAANSNQYTHNHNHLLYGEEYVRHTAVVLEGPFDVYAVGPGAVCTFGTSYTRQQVLRIAKFPRRVIAYDREPRQAQIQAERLCDELSVLPGETYRVIFSGKDAGESPKKEILKIRKRFLDG